MKILLASSNLGKVKEITAILKKIVGRRVEVLSLKDIFDKVPEIPENERTFTGNALAKAKWLADKVDGAWILADDSGLVVDALKGKPGVHSAIYAGEPKNDEKNTLKLLDEMKKFTEDSEREAHFCCAMVLFLPEEEKSYVAIGKCKGRIAFDCAGTEGFGYDPIFVPVGYDKTFAELSQKIKNKISHRAIALEILSDIFQELINGDEI